MLTAQKLVRALKEGGGGEEKKKGRKHGGKQEQIKTGKKDEVGEEGERRKLTEWSVGAMEEERRRQQDFLKPLRTPRWRQEPTPG